MSEPDRASRSETYRGVEICVYAYRQRRLGVPYFGANPFVADNSIRDFEVWAAKASAWWAGWLQEDRGRDASVQAHVHGSRFK